MPKAAPVRPAAGVAVPAVPPGEAAGALSRSAEGPDAAPMPAPDGTPHVNPEGELLWASSPSRYIARVSAVTGREVLRPIDPDELLVAAHRDRHPVEVAAAVLASRFVKLTGREEAVRDGLRRLEALGTHLSAEAGRLTGSRAVEKGTKRLLGVTDRTVSFRFREATYRSAREVARRIERLRAEARAALAARGRSPRLSLLLTGATGFLGQEILAQAAADGRIASVTCVVRPRVVRDPAAPGGIRVLSPAERGRELLSRLGLAGRAARKFRFVSGDVEKPLLGIAPEELAALGRTVTHVVHCAASVAFDESYEASFRANVLGCRNALALSLGLQRAEGSPFVLHVALETSYVHGRRKRALAQEGPLVFPRGFYNNFYELTKAMASIETDRALVEDSLRVVQLLPAIVIGEARTGNNRGDTKVLNAPLNAFGRAREALEALRETPFGAPKAAAVSAFGLAFPADRTAEVNLVTVDRVVEGVLAALTRPEAVGERVHLATDHRIRVEEIVRIVREELGVDVRLADPTLFRNVTLPLVSAVLSAAGEAKLAGTLERLGTIFGGYGEWGQPIHGVGNDVRVLGLPVRRPNTTHAFRMLCRHNRLVQDFGRVKDPDEVARRERAWAAAVERIERDAGRVAGSLDAAEFGRRLEAVLDLGSFRLRGEGAAVRRRRRSS